jgi:spore coat protein H
VRFQANVRRGSRPAIRALLCCAALWVTPLSAQVRGKAPGKPSGAPPKPKSAPPAKPASPASPTPAPPSATEPKAPKVPKAPRPDESIAFFRDGVVPHLRILISDAELRKLREKNREYVRCTVAEDDRKQYERVAIHLKGAAGSFRNIDDKPALTLNFDKFHEDQEFHSLDKLHLNNSVQDPSYLNELICSELFLSAGIPAPRVTHARVTLNGRDLGFYVLKEGFNKRFLKRHFSDADGNLYEGGFVQDVDGSPRLQNGKGTPDGSDVRALVAACREPDPTKRWQQLEQLLDVDKFLTFMALELMTCHWDGYCNNRNNYRFYFEPKSGKVQFLPHGMDQMFGDPNFPILNVGTSVVGRAVLSNPDWRHRYRERITALMREFVPPTRLQQRVDQHFLRLRPVVAELGPDAAKQFEQRAQDFRNRIAARATALVRLNSVPEIRTVGPRQPTLRMVEPTDVGPARPVAFSTDGVAALAGWSPQAETDDTGFERQDRTGTRGGRLSITIGMSGRGVASWRTKVKLPPGKYRFEGMARTISVTPLTDDQGTGAGLRISGSVRTNQLVGTVGWTELAHPFEVVEAVPEVQLVAELRGAAGSVVFDLSSLRLVQVK